jgi:hypothetical protein
MSADEVGVLVSAASTILGSPTQEQLDQWSEFSWHWIRDAESLRIGLRVLELSEIHPTATMLAVSAISFQIQQTEPEVIQAQPEIGELIHEVPLDQS